MAAVLPIFIVHAYSFISRLGHYHIYAVSRHCSFIPVLYKSLGSSRFFTPLLYWFIILYSWGIVFLFFSKWCIFIAFQLWGSWSTWNGQIFRAHVAWDWKEGLEERFTGMWIMMHVSPSSFTSNYFIPAFYFQCLRTKGSCQSSTHIPIPSQMPFVDLSSIGAAHIFPCIGSILLLS